MKLNQNQYSGKDNDKSIFLHPGSIYIATDTKKIYLYDDSGLAYSSSGILNANVSDFYSNLPSDSTEDSIGFVLNNQGAAWLPGNLGGSYYPKGWYIFRLGEWIHTRYAVDNQIGLNTDLINTNKNSISNHASSSNNPHSVTKAQVGLGNADNTSDLNKPLSTATINALANIGAGTGVNTGDQDISLTGQILSLSAGSSVTIPDTNTQLTLLDIASMGFVQTDNDTQLSDSDIAAFGYVKTGNQDISLTGQTLSLSSGSSVKIMSDDLIIVTAGKQSNTFVNNVFTFVDTVDYTNNSKTLVYTGALLTSAVHLFDYDSKSWNVNYTYNYNLGDYNGVTKTITKS